MRRILPSILALVILSAVAPQAASATVDEPCPCAADGTEVCNSQTNMCEYSSSAIGQISNGGAPTGAGLNLGKISSFKDQIIGIINFVLLPLLIAVAFIVFLWGVFKFFIWGASDEDARTEGRTYVLYGVLGFVIIFSLWGLVNVGISVFNLGGASHPGYPQL